MFPAILNGLALLLAICIQTVQTPICGAWMWIMTISAGMLLTMGCLYKNSVWYASLFWFLALGCSCFIFAPVSGGAAIFWMLAAAPVISFCMDKRSLKPHLIGFSIVLACYAAGVIIQWAMDTRYTLNGDISMSVHSGWSWPLLDSNNAAAVLLAGVIGSFFQSVSKGKKWYPLLALFLWALLLTHSRAGAISAGVGCFIILYSLKYYKICLTSLLSIPLAMYGALVFLPNSILSASASMDIRLQLWADAWRLLWLRPWMGLGLGSFGFYYAQVRHEVVTAGGFAHNDPLQFAIEMGIPMLLVFFCLIISTIVTTTRRNAVATAYLAGIFLMAMTEFQLYVPPVSMLIGLALAYHRLTYCDYRNIIPIRR